MDHEAKNPVKATRRSFDILETLSEMGGARLTTIAEALDLPDSTVHNHLSTLVETGFVVKEDDSYRLSLRFLTFGEYARERYKISQSCREEVNELAAETGETASVMVSEADRGYFIVHERGGSSVPVDIYPGKRVALHALSFGKVLLAHLPESDVEAILDRYGLPEYTAETITDREELLAELDAAREQGYAVDDEERLRGVRSIATAVKNDRGIAVGAIGITGPTNRLTTERIEGELREQLMNTKNVIELKLIYS